MAVFAPKDKHLSGNISLANHVALVIIIDSVRYAQGISEVKEVVGCSLPTSTVECLKQCDAKHEHDKVYHSSIKCRWQFGAEQQENKIIEFLQHQNSDKKEEFKYEPSIAICKDVEENSGNNKFKMTPAAPNSIVIGTKNIRSRNQLFAP